ncbi:MULTISPECIES: hypothetical protein [Burkholderiaceae]|jgi:hypothetical protein|uniref:hypothetical protein n=1 Tax=Burkholderiaceae TaxID=119060 RepID=UPI000D04ED5F|nr:MULTISPECIES: hypothetical protein [Burkholderiaceae]MBU9366366.1 hypothetical protein [Burkholderia multivorans]PRZ43823.1 hypothetical protein BX589_1493 [Paraburkholderia fungorum]
MKRKITIGLLTWFPGLFLSFGLTGCFATGIQQSSESDPGGTSKIVLADGTGNVDGHKRPFAKEYIVAPGNHTVGVCNGGALCERYYYIKFYTKPGFTYTVYEQARNVSVSNRLGYLIDTRGFVNELRDGVPVTISFKDGTDHGN